MEKKLTDYTKEELLDAIANKKGAKLQSNGLYTCICKECGYPIKDCQTPEANLCDKCYHENYFWD